MLLLIRIQKELNVKRRRLKIDQAVWIYYLRTQIRHLLNFRNSNNHQHHLAVSNTYVLNDSTLSAEIFWCLKVIKCHFSLRSCEGLDKLFRKLFPDSELASKFALGKTKCAYMINFGLVPYFRESLTRDINQ